MKVLIVDDDIATVDAIKENVDWEAIGVHSILTAYNIVRAKELLCENSVDIVISDIEMPQGSGIDLLTWFRENNLSGKFLLLTCHESFTYAKAALKLEAAEYLLKPLDVEVIEMALKKLVLKIQEERELEAESQLGKLAMRNRAQLRLDFLRGVVYGRITGDMSSNIERSGVELDPSKKYRLVFSRITDVDRDREKLSSSLLTFVLANVHSEIFFGKPEIENVIFDDQGNHINVISICTADDEEETERKCRELIFTCKDILSSTVSCCVSRVCTIGDFYEVYQRCRKLLVREAAYYGSVFCEERINISEERSGQVLDEKELLGFLEAKDKMKFVGYLKEKVNEKMVDKTLDSQMLDAMVLIIWKVVYTYFVKKDISSEAFFQDEAAQTLTKKASQSVVDMMRFVTYLLEEVFKTEKESKKVENISDKVNRYIHQHYMESISRTEIADELHLAAEYVSKRYRKETGEGINDYLNKYRVEKAKNFLQGGRSVSEVSESCGFDSFTYFSTVFKKYVGVSPNQFKKNNQ